MKQDNDAVIAPSSIDIDLPQVDVFDLNGDMLNFPDEEYDEEENDGGQNSLKGLDGRRALAEKFGAGEEVSLLMDGKCIGTAKLQLPTDSEQDQDESLDDEERYLRKKFKRRIHFTEFRFAEKRSDIVVAIHKVSIFDEYK